VITNELPGNQSPYKVDSGQGLRYVFGSHLACLIARPQDTGQPISGAVLSGAKGASFPRHQHHQSHEAWLVLEGVVSLTLAENHYTLTAGCYVNIPAGTPHGYQLVEHRSRILAWTFGGSETHQLYESLGVRYEGTVHPESSDLPDWTKLGAACDTHLVDESGLAASMPGQTLATAPPGLEPFVLGPYEGERMLAAEQLYTMLGAQGHSGGTFISLLTEGPTGPEIPRHYHNTVTELFFCLKGALRMFVGDGYITLEPGDFAHVPPGAVHSFQLARNDTRFIGFITPGLFENFFRYMCQPFDGSVYPLNPPPFRFDCVLAHMHELDLHLMGRPGGPGA
jgi:quercetin 2,3-dioxygenase